MAIFTVFCVFLDNFSKTYTNSCFQCVTNTFLTRQQVFAPLIRGCCKRIGECLLTTLKGQSSALLQKVLSPHYHHFFVNFPQNHQKYSKNPQNGHFWSKLRKFCHFEQFSLFPILFDFQKYGHIS